MDLGCAFSPKPVFSGFLVVVVLLAACSTSEESSAPLTVAERTTVATTVPDTTTAPSTTTEASTTTPPPSTTSPEMTVEFSLVPDPDHHYPRPDPMITTTACVAEDPTCHVEGWSADWQVASGDFTGTITNSLQFVFFGGHPEGVPVGLLWFEGTVSGCGTGGVAIRWAGRYDPDGGEDRGWEVVAGLGVGDLATLTGDGTRSATLPMGGYTGMIRCHGGADTTVFSTTLLAPPAESGTEVAVPAHSPTSVTDSPIEPHPAQTDPPDMWVSVVDYGQWTSTMLNLGARFPERSTTPVRNTMVSTFTTDDSSALFAGVDCQLPLVVGRVFLDDALYPEFRGAWDLVPIGLQGGGTYNATTNEGRVRCGP